MLRTLFLGYHYPQTAIRCPKEHISTGSLPTNLAYWLTNTLSSKMARISLPVVATLLLPFLGVNALRAVMPVSTMPGFVATVGMSPRPTHPPEVPRGIPKELAKRGTTIDYPAPGYYCGLVDNDISSFLWLDRIMSISTHMLMLHQIISSHASMPKHIACTTQQRYDAASART